MHAPNEMWPRWIPWEVKTVWNMPIALWLSKPMGRKRGRRPSQLCDHPSGVIIPEVSQIKEGDHNTRANAP